MLEDKKSDLILSDDGSYEFKILRSKLWNTFSKRERRDSILKEESLAGWSIVEMIGSDRIRIRPALECRNNDEKLSIDPYRTYVPILWSDWLKFLLLIVSMTIGGAAIGTALGLFFDKINL